MVKVKVRWSRWVIAFLLGVVCIQVGVIYRLSHASQCEDCPCTELPRTAATASAYEILALASAPTSSASAITSTSAATSASASAPASASIATSALSPAATPVAQGHAGVAVTLFLGSPRWFQNRYTMLVNQVLSSLEPDWVVQIFYNPSKKMALQGVNYPGIRRAVDQRRVVLTPLPKSMYGVKRNDILMSRYVY
ncbi:hypothetical protein B484DRAFT_74397 [Ochromonadaceae sp. CCMP2298]|nr:hypothetical protein B484DRAFT_74397 [Ochromonadaceae sp. CCMP2298]